MAAVEGVVVRHARLGLAIAAIVSLFGFGSSSAVAAPRTEVSILVPIVAANGTNELLTADELQAATSPGGPWWVLASAALSSGATLAVDSRISASIDALGADVPTSVSDWYRSITAARPLALAWGNADPFVLSSLGPSFRVSAIALSEISGVPSADIVVWPTGNAGNSRSPQRLENLGFTQVIASDAVFPDAVGAFSARVSDDVLRAVQPGSTSDLGDVVAEVRANARGSLVVAFPRDPQDIDPQRASLLLSLLSARTSVTGFTPTASADIGSFTPLEIDSRAIRQLMNQHRTDRRVADIAADPAVIGTPRLRRMCVVAGMVQRAEFASLVRSYVKTAASYDEFVSVEIGSDFTVLANSTELPLTVTNSTSTDVTVIAHVASQSAIVNIATPAIEVRVPANSSTQVLFPMSSVANGSTSLRAELETRDGQPISAPVIVDIQVQAQWEGLAIVAFVVLVGAILGIGIVRTVRDRRARA